MTFYPHEYPSGVRGGGGGGGACTGGYKGVRAVRPESVAGGGWVRPYMTILYILVAERLAGFPFQPVVHNWFIKGRGMYCSVYGKVHIKDPLLLIEKNSLCGGSGFPSKTCVNMTI